MKEPVKVRWWLTKNSFLILICPVLTHWNVVQKKQETEPGLDYIAMNRMAAKSHVLDAGTQAVFRKSHPVRRKKVNPQIKKEDLLPSDKDSAYTYGKPTR